MEIAIIVLLGYVLYTYFRFKTKNKLITRLSKTISDTHNHYREKYDFFIHFKERYDDMKEDYFKIVDELKETKELLLLFQTSSEDFLKPLEDKQIEDLPVITKTKRSRKPKVE